MKQRYIDFLEEHKKITMLCKDLTADMASFYLVFSGMENGKADQRKYLHDKMTSVNQTLRALTDALTARQRSKGSR